MLLAYQPIKRLVSVYGDINYGIGAAQRVFALLDEAHTSEHEPTLPDMPAPKHSIRFDNVSFSYQTHTPILTKTGLTIAQGARIGIVGQSGIGKSTITDLLLRFLEPTDGTIWFDAHRSNECNTASVRRHIGYVGQHPFLFNDTVFANVAYGTPRASMDDVILACKQAHADEFITQLADGYHTNVGENGKLLSGGQKQRLTIARALLRKPAVLIFDEATSALDEKTEELIEETVATLDRHTTILVISHRPRLLTRMDTIFTIKNQTIVQTSAISSVDKPTLQK
jgi:ABC-type multidrug transport system fused ATPase/permease subunit